MTTIILVAIGILLAAAAALFVVFYGGDAFNGGDAKAQAATLLNAGTNVESAARGYRVDTGGAPDALDDLTGASESGRWLQSIPSLRGAGGAQDVTVIDGATYYRVAGVADKVCAIVNQDLHIAGDVPATPGDLRRGCAGAAGARFFFVRLDGSGGVAGGGGADAPYTPPETLPILDPSRQTGAISPDQMAQAVIDNGNVVQQVVSRQTAVPTDLAGAGIPQYDYSRIEYYCGTKPNGQPLDGCFAPRIASPVFYTPTIGAVWQGEGEPYVFRMNPDERTCRAINAAIGGDFRVHYELPEGCGFDGYSTHIYWKRIDTAQSARQATYLRGISDLAVNYQGSAIRTDAAPSDINLYNIAQRPVIFDGGDRMIYRQDINYKGICDALNGGAMGVVDYSRATGCGDYSGHRYYWRDVTVAWTAPRVALVDRIYGVAAAAVAKGAEPRSWQDLGGFPGLQGLGGYRNDDFAFERDGGSLFMQLDLNSAPVCAVLNARGGQQGYGSGYPDHQRAEGCNEYSGHYYYWRRLY